MRTLLSDVLAGGRVLILDGAMGTEMQRRGVDVGLPLWSANALMTAPETVLAIHREYLAAGAEIITANTFRTTRRTFRNAGRVDRSEELTALAVWLARRARDEAGGSALVAGSIAPLEDCYRPDLVPPDAELAEEHAELAIRLALAGVDLILVETMNTVREAAAACRATTATGLETVVSFLCRPDGRLSSGESLEEGVAALIPLRPAGLSLNCIPPRFVGPILARLRTLTTLPLAAYANVGRPGGEQAGVPMRIDVDEESYARFAAEWIREGAVIVGGCCGTTPSYIRALREELPQTHRGTE